MRETSNRPNRQETLSSPQDNLSELTEAETPYGLLGPEIEPVPPGRMAELTVRAFLLMPALLSGKHLRCGRRRERDKELRVWGDQGTSCPKRQVGQQHSREEMKDVPEGQERAGYSSRKGTAGPMLTSCSFQKSSLSKSVLTNHLLSSRKMLPGPSICLIFLFPDLS